MPTPRILVLHHSLSGNTQHLASVVAEGVRTGVPSADVVVQAVEEAPSDAILQADGLLIGCPEMLGYMSGGLKDYLDRSYHSLDESVVGKPYAVFVAAGWDGRRAAQSLDAILGEGLRMRKVLEPAIALRAEIDLGFQTCRELGEAMATGLEMGIFSSAPRAAISQSTPATAASWCTSGPERAGANGPSAAPIDAAAESPSHDHFAAGWTSDKKSGPSSKLV